MLTIRQELKNIRENAILTENVDEFTTFFCNMCRNASLNGRQRIHLGFALQSWLVEKRALEEFPGHQNDSYLEAYNLIEASPVWYLALKEWLSENEFSILDGPSYRDTRNMRDHFPEVSWE